MTSGRRSSSSAAISGGESSSVRTSSPSSRESRPGEAQLPHHLAVQRREEEADPVGLRQQLGHGLDAVAVGGEAQLGPLPLDAPGEQLDDLVVDGLAVAHLPVGHPRPHPAGQRGDLVVGRRRRPCSVATWCDGDPSGNSWQSPRFFSEAAATRALKRAAPMAT